MTGEEMKALTRNGLNALHIYAEKRRDGKAVGASAEYCDYLIDLAQANGVIVVLTIGEMSGEPEEFELDTEFLYEFWEFYSERYKDKEHVIFEICNEPPLLGNMADIQAHAYAVIRKHAPDNMVLFYSFSMTDDLESLLPHIEKTERLIGEDRLWENAALAFHGYEGQEDLQGADYFRSVIHTLTRRGYPLINTELPNRFEQSGYPDTALLRVCEEEHISWLSFVFWTRITEPSYWRGQLEAAGLTWQPDHGDWPVPKSKYPFAKQKARDTVANSPANYVREYRGFSYRLQSNDYLDVYDLNFGTRKPLAFSVTAKAEGAGTLTLRQGALNGPVIGSCPVADTGGEYREMGGYLSRDVDGIADIFYVFTSEHDGVLYFRDWSFHLPNQADYSNPYRHRVFAANAPFFSPGILKETCGDTESDAPLQVDGIINNSYLLYDFVAFQGRDITLHIRARAIGGGRITVSAGDGKREYYELGSCEINGRLGEWAEYTCALSGSRILMYDPEVQYWNLKFTFNGEESERLCAISEFWFAE